jgi:hypothetical protein
MTAFPAVSTLPRRLFVRLYKRTHSAFWTKSMAGFSSRVLLLQVLLQFYICIGYSLCKSSGVFPACRMVLREVVWACPLTLCLAGLWESIPHLGVRTPISSSTA